MDIAKRIKEAPLSPGVYMMKNRGGEVIYVGKASSLRKRLEGHYHAYRKQSAAKDALLYNTSRIDWIVTSHEAEALILEAGLIKKYKPSFNISLKDDKSFPYIKVTTDEEYPRLLLTRNKAGDPASYYGPYTDVKLLKAALAFLRKIFPLRACRRMPKKECLDFHIGQCLAPCIGKVDKPVYVEKIRELCLFLGGEKERLISELNKKMARLSKDGKFEEAALARDQIAGLTNIVEKYRNLDVKDELSVLKDMLGLPCIPNRIEAFDISNISGRQSVGSMVMFLDGKPYKNHYRRFRIKGIAGIDDYSMIRQIVMRRYGGTLKSKLSMPDLIVIDGGKGHISCAFSELEKLGIKDIPIIGIAKQFERLYLLKRKEPLIPPLSSGALHLIQRIRDEAHRFALRYHLLLRSKVQQASELDTIPGVGPKKKSALIKRFGSIDEIKKAPLDELIGVKGLDRRTAMFIRGHFRGKRIRNS
ncbi:MAG: hypothetical protein AUJ75_00985 [Candidatus Omnitrophica bacterium CG1_02_49_10]|nr:MAG: hypothetical protein AUJ75_00985 [Candidatus Omnitrophica bacterium CG1_02_49_10]